MPKNSSARYYKKRKGLKKGLMKDIKIFLKRKTKDCNSMVANNIKIFMKMKNLMNCGKIKRSYPDYFSKQP